MLVYGASETSVASRSGSEAGHSTNINDPKDVPAQVLDVVLYVSVAHADFSSHIRDDVLTQSQTNAD